MATMNDSGSRASTRWAWVAVALAPVALLVGIALGFASDEGVDSTGRQIGGVLLVLFVLALPTAAVYLASRAPRSGPASSRVGLVLAGIELALILVCLPTLVVGTSTFFIALAVYVVAVMIGLALERRRPIKA